MRVAYRCSFLILLLLVGPSAAMSQAPPIEYNNVVSANPFLLLFEWFNAEYERKASATTTLGLRGSTLTIGVDDEFDEAVEDTRYISGRAFVRYYPAGAFQRFFVGASLGATAITNEGDSFTTGAIGFDLGYNWMLGERRKFYVSLGLGLERLLGGDVTDNIEVTIPSIRLVNIGIAF